MRKARLLASAMISFSALLGGCDAPVAQQQVIHGKTMGTVWRVTVAGVPAGQIESLRKKIQQQLDADDRELSTWKSDSRLSQFNQSRQVTPQPVSDGMADIILKALRVGRLTGGAMDITLGPLVNLWGFGPAKTPAHTPDAARIAQAKAITGLQHLRLTETAAGAYLQKDLPELYLDLSTVGEGYATDHLARLLEQNGVRNYLVSVGGALLSRGLNAQNTGWRVAIQKPADTENQVQAIVDLQGQGISTSGDYRNYYQLDGKRISHVIDPVTGRPIEHHLVSATVIAPTALEADAWDTGLMVLGTEKAKALARQQHLAVYLISYQQGRFVSWVSPAFRTFLASEQP